ALGAEGRVEYDDAVSLPRAAGELSIAQQASLKRADPDVEVSLGVPGGNASRRLSLDGVAAVGKRGLISFGVGDAVRGMTVGVLRGEDELDHRIGHEAAEDRRRFALVGVSGAVVAIENVDLTIHLFHRDLFSRLVGVMHHVYDDGDLVWLRP